MTMLKTRGEQATLLDLLDRLLDKGVVVAGDLTISVAEVDLIFASLRLVVTSVDKAWETRPGAADNWEGPWEGHPSHLEPGTALGSADGQAPLGPERSTCSQTSRLAPTAEHSQSAPSLVSGGALVPQEGAFDPDKAANGVAQLAVTIVELLRQLLEREVLRRMDRGTLTPGEVERLGRAFVRLDEKMREIKEVFKLREEDLNLDLGPFGKLM